MPIAPSWPSIMHTYIIFEDLDETYLITMTADAHEKVIWLNISVDEVLCVYIFNPADHLEKKRENPSNSQKFLNHC